MTVVLATGWVENAALAVLGLVILAVGFLSRGRAISFRTSSPQGATQLMRSSSFW
jgi:hypothetical protein